MRRYHKTCNEQLKSVFGTDQQDLSSMRWRRCAIGGYECRLRLDWSANGTIQAHIDIAGARLNSVPANCKVMYLLTSNGTRITFDFASDYDLWRFLCNLPERMPVGMVTHFVNADKQPMTLLQCFTHLSSRFERCPHIHVRADRMRKHRGELRNIGVKA